MLKQLLITLSLICAIQAPAITTKKPLLPAVNKDTIEQKNITTPEKPLFSKKEIFLLDFGQFFMGMGIYAYFYLPVTFASTCMCLSDLSLLGSASLANIKSRSLGGFYALFSGLNLSYGLTIMRNSNNRGSFFDGASMTATGITSLALAFYLNRENPQDTLGLSLISGSSFFIAITALCLDKSVNPQLSRSIAPATISAAMLGTGLYLSKDWIKEHPTGSIFAGAALAALTAFTFFSGRKEIHDRSRANAELMAQYKTY
jgi:hypothetical protein